MDGKLGLETRIGPWEVGAREGDWDWDWGREMYTKETRRGVRIETRRGLAVRRGNKVDGDVVRLDQWVTQRGVRKQGRPGWTYTWSGTEPSSALQTGWSSGGRTRAAGASTP